MDNSKNIRISLSPGTVLHGGKGNYSVINIICRSERSVTVSCRDERRRTWRLKLYNGDSSITEEIQKAILAIPMKGVVLPYDIGMFSGLPFSVTQELQVTNTEQYPVSMKVLMGKIIPQIAFVMNQYHQNRILLRDICPEHILYKPEAEEIAYCGFNNAASLKGKATITKELGYGQKQSYLAPETENYGYSACSDYFSLGVTILTILKGHNPMKNMSRQDYLKCLLQGNIPGIDVRHLKNTPYDLYSAEDKVLYLILGLMIPDPRKRWGYGEIRCWSNNQKIPLIQSGKRVPYQFSEPCLIGGNKCWNERQLASALAAEKAEWTDMALHKIASFSQKQNLSCANTLNGILHDRQISVRGRIFRCIYTLEPSMDGLWWEGREYSDTRSLVEDIKRKAVPIEVLSWMLKDKAISFFEKSRQEIGIHNGVDICKIKEMEYMESAEPGKGVQRCMMVFANDAKSRFFTVEGRKYHSLAQMLGVYKENGKRLKELSKGILSDHSFQAWLWAKGMENAGVQASQSVSSHPDQSFYFLMSICEAGESDVEAKKLARELFLKWGDYAPIVWLCDHMEYYRSVSLSHRTLYDTLESAGFHVDDTLEALSRKANALVDDYQTFVGRTLDNPFVLENENIEEWDIGYYPLYENGYFCCSWSNGLEVCPAFLKSMGESINKQEIDTWLRKCEEEEVSRLNDRAREFPSNWNGMMESEGSYLAKCRKNIGASVFMIMAAIVLLVMAGRVSTGLALICFVAAAAYPVCSLMWYYRRMIRISIWIRNKVDIQDKQTQIEAYIRNIRSRVGSICSGIVNGQTVKCMLLKSQADSGIHDVDVPEGLDLSIGQKVLAYLSMYGYVILTAVFLGDIYGLFVAASIYTAIYGVAVPYLINKRKFVSSCFAWSIITLSVTMASIAGGIFYGNTFFITMNWIPVICIIVVVVISLILAFL